ncbi:uncharacterized protein [Leptinotarsa decemlineata]|uniref:uncharacterized protein n=1 Tax=Leptinotarsa decemlineata TaxID=7539 RepID=UPI003D3081F2
MDQLATEKLLSFAYLLCICMGATSSITTGIAWGHWYKTLDQCVNRNCSCILYGKNTATIFLGGEQAPCIWVTFGPLIHVFFSLGLLCFHGYRVLFTTKSPQSRSTRTMLAKLDTGESIEIETVSQENTSPLPKVFWISTSVISSIFTLYSLVHFAIFLDGFYGTCKEYRTALEKLLYIGGSALPVIYNRLSCQSVYDFMDYMQMDSGNAYRNGIINTGLALVIGIMSSFVTWISYLFASILNIRQTCISND